MAKFQPGQSGNPAGRPKGSKNRYTQMRDAFLDAFDQMGGTDGLVKWAMEDPKAFYDLAVRILPKDINLNTSQSILDVLASISNPAQRAEDDTEMAEESADYRH